MIDTEPMPETVAAVAALSGLRASYPLLATVAETEAWGGRQAARPRTPMSELARLRTDERLRTDRAYTRWMEIRGIRQVVTGVGTAPIRADLLDAELLAQATVVDQAWIAASTLGQATQWLSARVHLTAAANIWTTATSYLDIAVWDVPPATAAAVARELDTADRAVRTAVGLTDIRVPVPGSPDCPACGRRALRIDVTPADERAWTVACQPDCLCVGTQCSCQRPGREPGQRHLWTVTQLAPLVRGQIRVHSLVTAIRDLHQRP